MIANALKLLFETGQKAKAIKVLDVPGDGRTCHLDIDGVLDSVCVPPPVVRHEVGLLDDMIRLAKEAASSVPGGPEVWYGPNAVTLVYDGADRRDLAVMSLKPTPQLTTLIDLERNAPGLEQRDFIKLLRLKLGMPSDIVNPFRKLDWQHARTAQGSIGRGKESLGKSIEAQVQGVDLLPELITVPVPIFDAAGERAPQPIRCTVEIDPHAAQLTLMPLPSQISEAEDRALASIYARLSEGLTPSVPCYFGSP